MAVQFLKIPKFFSNNSPHLNRRNPNSPASAAAASKNQSSPPPNKIAATKEVLTDLSPLIKVYTDGTVERLVGTPFAPPSPEDPATGVASEDATISRSTSARIYRPKLAGKVPILVYYHGGGFCVGSAFSVLQHRYVNLLSAAAGALVVAVEFRKAPEHPLPAAYDDSWDALEWVCSHAFGGSEDGDSSLYGPHEWILTHGDLSRLYIGGDSSGANIAHNLAMQAGSEPLPGNTKIAGAIISHPLFWGSQPIGNEANEDRDQSFLHRNWMLVYPDAAGGIDNPSINPFANGAPSLERLGCSRILVCVAEEDETAARGRAYAEAVRRSGWGGEVEVVEVEGEGHAFHVYNPGSEKAVDLIKRMGVFIS